MIGHLRAARTGRLAVRALGVTLALVLAAGCGSRAATVGGGSGDDAGPAWGEVGPSDITAVRLTDGGRALAVEFPVSAGAPDCARGAKGVVDTVENGTVHVRVTYESRASDTRSGCTGSEPGSATVPLPGPIGEQKVLVNSSYVFTATGAVPPALRRCGPRGCDPGPTGCTPGSYEQAMAGADSPKHAMWDLIGCDGSWLALDVSYPTGPVCGEAGPECRSHGRTVRWYFRATSEGWSAITSSVPTDGCTGVRRVEPRFPAAVCAPPAPSGTARP